MKARVKDDAVEVLWNRTRSSEPPSGYYVIVQDMQSDFKENPVYVHVNNDAKRVKLIGMRPETTYQLKV